MPLTLGRVPITLKTGSNLTQHKKGTTARGIVFADIHCHCLAQHGLDLLTQNVPVVNGCIACSLTRTMVSQPPESKRYSLWGNADIKMTMIYVSLGKSHIREQVEKLNAIQLLPSSAPRMKALPAPACAD